MSTPHFPEPPRRREAGAWGQRPQRGRAPKIVLDSDGAVGLTWTAMGQSPQNGSPKKRDFFTHRSRTYLTPDPLIP